MNWIIDTIISSDAKVAQLAQDRVEARREAVKRAKEREERWGVRY